MSLSKKFVLNNLQTFRRFCQVHLYDFFANSARKYFPRTSKHRQAEVGRFLRICLHERFIRKCAVVLK